jgi:hypothetical protein
VQALLQSMAQVDATDSDGYDPARDHRSRFHGCEGLWVGEWRWKPTIVRLRVDLPVWLELMAIADWMVRRASGVGAEPAV